MKPWGRGRWIRPTMRGGESGILAATIYEVKNMDPALKTYAKIKQDDPVVHIKDATRSNGKFTEPFSIGYQLFDDAMMGGIATIGGGATIVWENFTCWDPSDKESTEGALELFETTSKYGQKRGWGIGMERTNAISRGPDGRIVPKEERERKLLSQKQSFIYHYHSKIKKALNPNDLGDAYYWSVDEPEEEKTDTRQ